MEQRGVLLSWDDDKGFGFIQPQDGGPKLFVHISAMRGDARPNQGDAVFYLAGKDDQGRLRATHMRGEGLSIDRPAIRRKPREPSVRPAAAKKGRPAVTSSAARVRRSAVRRTSPVQHQIPKLMLWLALCLLPLIGSLGMWKEQGWMWPLAAYGGVSLLSMFLYWSDKRAAEHAEQRTPENVLHLSELLGGWPGALLAQQMLRHKTRKASYQQIFWLIILAHQLFWADWVLFDGRYLFKLLGN
ncbi:MAG: DUF1294 domain-containing protein [Pseudoalteromonas distincta]